MGSLLVKNGTAIVNGVSVNTDVLIENGIISKIGCCLNGNGIKELDAGGLYVLPGLIDEHVHLREPGLTYKEDFGSGTSAAAAGGMTLVLDMPNTLPPTDSAERLIEKKEIVGRKSHVDYGLYGLVRDTSEVTEVIRMINSGCIGFKSYMGPTTGNIPAPSHGTLYTILNALSEADVPLVVHAEDDGLIKLFTEKANKSDILSHLNSRPYVCETFSVGELASLSEYTGAHVHVAHVSSAKTVKIIGWAKMNGIKLTGEVTPHHLFLGSKIYDTAGNLAKINPPIRSDEDGKALLNAVSNGIISTVASDHSPHTVEEKIGDSPPSGFPGLETELPLMLDAVNAGKLGLSDVVRLMSENVARLFGIYPQYGSLLPGARGNITIISLNSRAKINAEKFYSKAKYSPFDGMELKGKVVYTVVGGETVYDGEVHDDIIGEFVKGK
ncbi:MAG: dihydroorotase family protein [Nitrososphaerota archaeon]|nr:dihydroorotase family protein [Nitrososphaerota archaeon]MDG6930903.1 dihydroorotase family protein [Nitrososphaerota archaeon]